MSVPQINPSEIADGNMGLFASLTQAKIMLGNPKVALFLDLVPERGHKLWDKFKVFKVTAGDVGFNEFIKKTIMGNPLVLFFPKGCTLSQIAQRFLMPNILEILGGKSMDDGKIVDLRFGVGDSYQKVRATACKGCHHRSCRHWLDPVSRSK